MKRILVCIILGLSLTACQSSDLKHQPEDANQAFDPQTSVEVFAEQKIAFEAEIKAGVFIGFKPVLEILHPERTLVFELKPMDQDRGMMLTAKNPFNKPLKYHINMIDFKGRAHKTSSCPIAAESSSYEMWPHPIPLIVISQFHFIEESSGMRCVY